MALTIAIIVTCLDIAALVAGLALSIAGLVMGNRRTNPDRAIWLVITGLILLGLVIVTGPIMRIVF